MKTKSPPLKTPLILAASFSLVILTTANATGTLVDYDHFTLKNGREANGPLNNTVTEGAWATWRASDTLLLVPQGKGAVIRMAPGKRGPAAASFPIKFPETVQTGDGVVRLTAKVNFGGISQDRKSWFGLGFARNTSSITINGTTWLQINTDGHWQLKQFNDPPIAEGDAPTIPSAPGPAAIVLEINYKKSSASIVIDGKEVAKDIILSKPALTSPINAHVILHFQWLNPRVSLDEVEVKAGAN